MATQYQIEQEAGITPEIAQHMMHSGTSSANNAMSLLKMQVDFYEPCGMVLLQEAVKDCLREMEK